MKGYLQTHLVHTREHLGLIGRLGLRNTALFCFSVLGVAVQQLLNLICLPVLLIYGSLLLADVLNGRAPWIVIAGSRDEFRIAWKAVYYGAGEDPVWVFVSTVGFAGSVVMLASNLLFVLINLIACFKRDYRDLWWAALLSPIYWVLGSIAAWKGAFQLIHKPHYWEKTLHGLSQNTGFDAADGGDQT